jgi:hypothetical protein
MNLGTSYDFTVDMGSLISEGQLKTVTSHVDDATAKGAKVIAGGKARPDIGPLFYEPTVLTDVSAEMERRKPDIERGQMLVPIPDRAVRAEPAGIALRLGELDALEESLPHRLKSLVQHPVSRTQPIQVHSCLPGHDSAAITALSTSRSATVAFARRNPTST